jgi:hypothetical protein
MLNYGFTFQPISASNRDRLHSVSATMVLRCSRLGQGQRLLSYRMVSKDWPFCRSTSLRDAMQSPGILVTNQDMTTWNFLSNVNFYGNYSSPCSIFFCSSVSIVVSFTVNFNSRELYIFRGLVCIAFSQIQALVLCLGR